MFTTRFETRYNEENIGEIEEFFDMPLEKRIFLISSVRKATQEEIKKTTDYINQQKSKGYSVYYPYMHTYQEDPKVLNIMTTNKYIIKNSGTIHIFYNPESIGSIIDLGITFGNKKPLVLANKESMIGKVLDPISILVQKYSQNKIKYDESTFVDKMISERNTISLADKYEVTWIGEDKEELFKLGIAFGLDKPIFLKNKEEIQRTEKKSPQNFLLDLHEFYSKSNK